jgi:Domain of unknown function (DUF4136)
MTRHARLLPLARIAVVTLAAALATALATGCATINTISSEVSSFGEWPAARNAGTYAFERLPSQEARADQQAALEAAARGALERAGFKAADPASADVLVQLGMRASQQARSPWDDPFFPRWTLGYGRGFYWGLNAHWSTTTSRYDREVAVLLRDRASGKTLYETRAVNSGFAGGADMTLLGAMFDAAMKDFPKPAVSPRRVDITLPSATAPTPEQTKIVR